MVCQRNADVVDGVKTSRDVDPSLPAGHPCVPCSHHDLCLRQTGQLEAVPAMCSRDTSSCVMTPVGRREPGHVLQIVVGRSCDLSSGRPHPPIFTNRHVTPSAKTHRYQGTAGRQATANGGRTGVRQQAFSCWLFIYDQLVLTAPTHPFNKSIRQQRHRVVGQEARDRNRPKRGKGRTDRWPDTGRPNTFKTPTRNKQQCYPKSPKRVLTPNSHR